MTKADPIWNAVLAAEDAHGDAAEVYARGEAAKATMRGDIEGAAHWCGIAEELNTLHAINFKWARAAQSDRREDSC